MSECIAVYGGSFNPTHVGHTLLAAYVLAAHEVDRMIVLPTADHAFGKPLAPFEHRMRMCELAMAPLARLEVSDLEARLGGVSRSLRTLQAVQQAHPRAKLRLVIGSDLVSEFPRWHAPHEIEALAPLLVVQRMGFVTDPNALAIPEVSSTELRARLEKGTPVTDLLSPAVAHYIEKYGLYRATA